MSIVEATDVELFKAGRPNVYRDIPADVYHALDACSASRLKEMRQSPAHCRYAIDNPKSSPAMLLGEALHCNILEYDRFVMHYHCAQRCIAMTGKSQQCSKQGAVYNGEDWFCTQHANGTAHVGGPVLTAAEWQTILFMAGEVRRNTGSRSLLDAAGPCELSLLWTDAETGLLCKARADKWAQKYQTLVDLKTTTDASRAAFEKSIFNFGYAIQAAHYLAGAEACGIDADTFAFVAVENNPPHCCAVYQLEPDAVAAGWRQRQALIARYAECVESGVWPGYSNEPEMIGLPAWASREEI